MIRKGLGQAGSLESCDALVMVELSAPGNGLLLEMDSPSLLAYGEDMKKAVNETIASLGIGDASVKVQDRGALDCTLRARVETAARRALAGLKEDGI